MAIEEPDGAVNSFQENVPITYIKDLPRIREKVCDECLCNGYEKSGFVFVI